MCITEKKDGTHGLTQQMHFKIYLLLHVGGQKKKKATKRKIMDDRDHKKIHGQDTDNDDVVLDSCSDTDSEDGQLLKEKNKIGYIIANLGKKASTPVHM